MAALAVGAGCGGDSDGGGGGTDGPYKIGYLGALSGPAASLAQGEIAALRGVVDDINASGGIHGRKIELISEDTHSDASQTAVAVRSMADDGVIAIAGLTISSDLSAAIPVVNQTEISVLSGAGDPASLVPVNKWIFGSGTPGAALVQPEIDAAKDITGSDRPRVSLVAIDTPAQLDWQKRFESAAPDEGVEVVHSASVPLAASDVTSQAQQLINGDPDVVIAHVVGSPLLVLVRKMRQLGYEGPVLVFHAGLAEKTLAELGDPEVYALRDGKTFAASKEEGGRYAKVIEDSKQESMATSNLLYGMGYLMGLQIEAGLEKCGADCDAENFNEALGDVEIENDFTWVPVTFSPDEHQGIETLVFHHVNEQGEIVPAFDGKQFTGRLHE